jgi:GMP synthase (glutamine-hydrolysing)
MELTPEVVELLIEAEAALPKLTSHRFVQQADVLRTHDFSEMNNVLFGFLDKLVR